MRARAVVYVFPFVRGEVGMSNGRVCALFSALCAVLLLLAHAWCMLSPAPELGCPASSSSSEGTTPSFCCVALLLLLPSLTRQRAREESPGGRPNFPSRESLGPPLHSGGKNPQEQKQRKTHTTPKTTNQTPKSHEKNISQLPNQRNNQPTPSH